MRNDRTEQKEILPSRQRKGVVINAETNKTPIDFKRIVWEGEEFYCIGNFDMMRPFFMNIVSHSDHWMFISSRGGLSAGRVNADNAIFPYYTDDKITDLSETTGSITFIRIHRADGSSFLWHPFYDGFGTKEHIERNLYKSIHNNTIIFEEILHAEGLIFRYGWSVSDNFGFVRRCSLQNLGSKNATIELLDGIQNILPAGVSQQLQNWRSNLVNAYRKSELHNRMGIYSLSANIIDKPEPSESLKASIAWSSGLETARILLSSLQMKDFVLGNTPMQEEDVRAEPGAYILYDTVHVDSGKSIEWLIAIDTNKGAEEITALAEAFDTPEAKLKAVLDDIQLGKNQLHNYLMQADGVQSSNDHLSAARHLSNVLFNIMRGGLFDNGHLVSLPNFFQYLQQHNRTEAPIYIDLLQQLPTTINRSAFLSYCVSTQKTNLIRLALEYLPLFFSRRHGDPSRPWNQFNIHIKDEDGSRILDYEGNWRDIFQNWEALAYSYPDFIEAMIARFLNASTADGYNPYRITRDGIDWEIIEPNDPWSFIGYWGDHQIIYLLKLLELSEKYHPGQIGQNLNTAVYSFANVPYRIQAFDAIVSNPYDTIHFDQELEETISKRVEEIGSDGQLLWNREGEIIHATLGEKLLIPLLAKLSNYVHEGGIWLNTQRPEWNDANNALVGNGVSMVTLYYIRRYLHFLPDVFAQEQKLQVSSEVKGWLEELSGIFMEYGNRTAKRMDNRVRMKMIASLGHAAQHYNQQVYAGLSGYTAHLSTLKINEFIYSVIAFIDHSIQVNKRPDGLFHAYNLLEMHQPSEAAIGHMQLMLEGQVAAISSGSLSLTEIVTLLDALKAGPLFRPDQYSYLLYPDKQLKHFLDKNSVEPGLLSPHPWMIKLAKTPHNPLLVKDIKGRYHFHKDIKNAADITIAIQLMESKGLHQFTELQKQEILQVFEQVFQHARFTGRSGTFYGYEGLNSIYWHMVSKLLLAVQEQIQLAESQGEDPVLISRLVDHYYEIRAGIGLNKEPEIYGAFPTDPYSHTPGHKGAQQPGMTGQVKEDIITRFGELGVMVNQGQMAFSGHLLRKSEFIPNDDGSASLSFTYCGVPIHYHTTLGAESLELISSKGETIQMEGLELNHNWSRQIIGRTGGVQALHVYIQPKLL